MLYYITLLSSTWLTCKQTFVLHYLHIQQKPRNLAPQLKSILGNCGIRTSNHLMGTYFSVNFRDIAELNFNYHHLSAHLYFLFLLFLFLYCLFGRCRSKGSQSYLDKDLITSHHTLHFTFSPPRVLPTLLQGLCSCSLGCCYLM